MVGLRWFYFPHSLTPLSAKNRCLGIGLQSPYCKRTGRILTQLVDIKTDGLAASFGIGYSSSWSLIWRVKKISQLLLVEETTRHSKGNLVDFRVRFIRFKCRLYHKSVVHNWINASGEHLRHRGCLWGHMKWPVKSFASHRQEKKAVLLTFTVDCHKQWF